MPTEVHSIHVVSTLYSLLPIFLPYVDLEYIKFNVIELKNSAI